MQQALNAGEDSGHIVRRAPAILENVEAELAVCVDVWVEHSAEELDRWRLVGVAFVEGEHQLEGAVLEGRLGWPEDDGVPDQKVVSAGGTADAARGVGGETLEVAD